jgi:hypothetical protein
MAAHGHPHALLRVLGSPYSKSSPPPPTTCSHELSPPPVYDYSFAQVVSVTDRAGFARKARGTWAPPDRDPGISTHTSLRPATCLHHCSGPPGPVRFGVRGRIHQTLPQTTQWLSYAIGVRNARQRTVQYTLHPKHWKTRRRLPTRMSSFPPPTSSRLGRQGHRYTTPVGIP